MKLFGKAVLSVAAMFMAFAASAQYYVTGSAKAGIKWREMEGQYYKLIYPEEIDSLAQRYMWLLESGKERVGYGVRDEKGHRERFKMNVILHPYTTRSNGTVVWAPKRMELYTRPMADAIYPEPWERQLALHESRHVMQIAPFTNRIFRPLSYIFGEQITGLGLGVYMRRWYLEGDAVVAETELSESGRGRNASFMEYYRAAAISGDTRSFERWYFGSNKYFTPDLYPFGYMIVSYGRISSGDYNLSGNIINGITGEFYNPNVVNGKFREYTGFSRRKLFREAFRYYSDYWKGEWRSRGEYTGYTPLSAGRTGGYYTEYRSPLVIGRDSLISIKYSNENPAVLVLIAGGKEKILHSFSSASSKLSKNGNDIIWTESVPDIRWEIGSVERLMAYDMESGRIRGLSGRESYYNPAVNSTGDSVAVVEYPVEGGSGLVFLDGRSYERIASVKAPENGQITETAYSGGKWYASVITDGGIGIFRYCDGSWERVIAEQKSSIKSLRGFADRLFFVSDIDGVNNIYMYDIAEGDLARVTNSEFGAGDPFVYDGEIYYSSLNTEGRFLVKSLLKKENNGLSVRLEDSTITSNYVYEPAQILAEQAESALQSLGKNDTAYKGGASFAGYGSKRYRKGTHLFNIHSWMPFYFNVNKLKNSDFDNSYEILSLGAVLYSQNLLGTAVSMLGYSYRNGHHAAHASFEYSGWYPVFRVNVDYNEDNKYRWKLVMGHDGYAVMSEKSDKSLLDITATVYLPLKFDGRGWSRRFTPQVHYQYRNDEFYSLSKNRYINRQQLVYGLQYYQVRDTPAGAVFPKWGFGLSAMGISPLSGSGEFGSVASFNGYVYLPGLFSCHGIKLGAGYQRQNVDGRLFYSDNLLSMPRGYTADFYSTNYYAFTVDYAIPFNLRGLDLSWLAYIKQIKVIPFADFGITYSKESGYGHHNAAGCDLVFNTNLFRLGSAVDIGVRYARRLNPAGNYFGMLFNVAIF